MRHEFKRAAALAAMVATTAWAQTPPRERIEITGSHIPRTDAEAALPVQTITREDIEKAGIQTTQELLDRVSAHMSYGAWTEANGIGNSLAGFTGASLRGLGVERTLVLLNGHRLAPYALSSGVGVDISGIPVDAIERVEVLKDGASAVYGTDAIGGVINFIMRRDFRGAEAFASYYGPQQGGGESWRASGALGYGDLQKDRFNVFLSASYLRQESLHARDRAFSRTAYLPEYGYDATSIGSWPANISQPAIFDPDTGAVLRPRGFVGTRNPTVPSSGPTSNSCFPPYSFTTVTTPLACRFDYASVIDSMPASEKTSLIGRGTWKLGSDAEAFAEASYYRGDFESRIAPSPVVNSGGGFELAPSVPTYPTAFVASLPGGRPDLPVRLNYRLVDFGPRVSETISEQWRAVAGVKGTVRDWDYEASLGYNANKQVQSLPSGWFHTSGIFGLLASGVINPFGANTPEATARVLATQVTGDISDNRAANVDGEMRLSGTPWTLEAGPVGLALGLTGRRESLKQVNAPILYTGDLLSAGDPQPSLDEVNRNVAAFYGELNIPLARALELNLAVRTDHYSDFGNTTNPKVSLRWQPRRDLLLRGSWGTGFRAPTLSDLHLPLIATAVGSYDDPLRCPHTGFETDCAADFDAKAGGNPNLKPEKSTQMNLGFVFEPFTGFSVSVDYYRVKIRDVITTVPSDAIFFDYDKWSFLVVRKPPSAATPGLPGRIDYVIQWDINAGDFHTAGYDLDARYRVNTAWGRFDVGITGTYVQDYKVQQFEDAVSGPGTGASGAISRWRHYASLDWTRGAWGATLGQTFQRGYQEIDRLTCPPFSPNGDCSGTRRVGSLDIYDLQARYTGFANLKLTLGVQNVFDRAPPKAFMPGQMQIGYDVLYGDPRGRTFYAAARYTFR